MLLKNKTQSLQSGVLHTFLFEQFKETNHIDWLVSWVGRLNHFICTIPKLSVLVNHVLTIIFLHRRVYVSYQNSLAV